MAFVTVEDESARTECLVFADLFGQKRSAIVADQILWLRARVSRREADLPKLVAGELRSWQEARAKALGLHLEVQAELFAGGLAQRLDDILASHAGEVPVYLHLVETGGRRTVLRSRKYRVSPEDSVANDLATLLGPGAARWAPRL